MTKFGKYIIDDWKNYIYYDSNLFKIRVGQSREILTDTRLHGSMMVFQGYDADSKDIPNCYYVNIASIFFDDFKLINGDRYYIDRFFSSIKEAKDHIDSTLFKIIKLRAFL